MWLEAVQACGDDAQECPTCGSRVRRRIYGEMYAGSFISDGERVDVRRIPDEGHIDPVVLDPITQYFHGGLYRLWPKETYYARGGKKLHRAVWESAFGPLPPKCHVHHKDGNPANNVLSNLECLPASTHLSIGTSARNAKIRHRKANGQIDGDPFFTDRAREKAAEWHRSEAGRLWHKHHAERSKSWEKWTRTTRDCEYCKKPFSALDRANGYQQKYCTASCKTSAYRKRKALGMV